VTGSWIEHEGGKWELKMALFGFVQLNNAHNGKRLGQALFKIIKRLRIGHKVTHPILVVLCHIDTGPVCCMIQIGWITCDNASNNSTMLDEFAKQILERNGKVFDPISQRIRYVSRLTQCCGRCHVFVNRCLAHIINLATQAVITSYSKSKHYNPADPEANLTGPQTEHGRDEVGLVRGICVKVSPCPGVYSSRNSRVLTSFVIGSFFSKAQTATH
jgi:hypothetical protein